MEPTLTLLATLILAPLATFAQAKPEVANATKAAKHAWESAPTRTSSAAARGRCQN